VFTWLWEMVKPNDKAKLYWEPIVWYWTGKSDFGVTKFWKWMMLNGVDIYIVWAKFTVIEFKK
jgi:hypothetical protein